MTVFKPLSRFERLSPSVSVDRAYETREAVGTRIGARGAPAVILICSWAAGSAKVIEKYTTRYRELYPYTHILLIRTSFEDLFKHPETSQDAQLEPAVKLIRKHPRVLAHVFSNGGSYKLVEVAKRYRNDFQTELPIRSLVIDSAPGKSDYTYSARALAVAFPQSPFIYYPGIAVVYFFLTLIFAYCKVTGITPVIERVARALNDPDLISKRAPRLYVYSKSDEMVWSPAVTGHGERARECGYEVDFEEFQGSKHVAHMVKDPRRYWTVVTDQWEKTLSRQGGG